VRFISSELVFFRSGVGPLDGCCLQGALPPPTLINMAVATRRISLHSLFPLLRLFLRFFLTYVRLCTSRLVPSLSSPSTPLHFQQNFIPSRFNHICSAHGMSLARVVPHVQATPPPVHGPRPQPCLHHLLREEDFPDSPPSKPAFFIYPLQLVGCLSEEFERGFLGSSSRKFRIGHAPPLHK